LKMASGDSSLHAPFHTAALIGKFSREWPFVCGVLRRADISRLRTFMRSSVPAGANRWSAERVAFPARASRRDDSGGAELRPITVRSRVAHVAVGRLVKLVPPSKSSRRSDDAPLALRLLGFVSMCGSRAGS
jgi:hypothetical protein